MKKAMKSCTALFLALCMILTVALCGCQPKTPTDKTSTEDGTKTPVEIPASDIKAPYIDHVIGALDAMKTAAKDTANSALLEAMMKGGTFSVSMDLNSLVPSLSADLSLAYSEELRAALTVSVKYGGTELLTASAYLDSDNVTVACPVLLGDKPVTSSWSDLLMLAIGGLAQSGDAAIDPDSQVFAAESDDLTGLDGYEDDDFAGLVDESGDAAGSSPTVSAWLMYIGRFADFAAAHKDDFAALLSSYATELKTLVENNCTFSVEEETITVVSQTVKANTIKMTVTSASMKAILDGLYAKLSEDTAVKALLTSCLEEFSDLFADMISADTEDPAGALIADLVAQLKESTSLAGTEAGTIEFRFALSAKTGNLVGAFVELSGFEEATETGSAGFTLSDDYPNNTESNYYIKQGETVVLDSTVTVTENGAERVVAGKMTQESTVISYSMNWNRDTGACTINASVPSTDGSDTPTEIRVTGTMNVTDTSFRFEVASISAAGQTITIPIVCSFDGTAAVPAFPTDCVALTDLTEEDMAVIVQNIQAFAAMFAGVDITA